jgi:hypothetical protein
MSESRIGTTVPCAECGAEFVVRTLTHRFCSRACVRANEGNRRIVKPLRKCASPECDVMLNPSRGKRYCSAKCRKHGEYLRVKERRAQPDAVTTRTCKAEGCFKSFVANRNRNYCSDECKQKTHNARHRYTKVELPECYAEGCTNPVKGPRAKYCIDCVKPLRVLAHRNCVECGTPFAATSRRHLCCSRNCTNKRSYRKRPKPDRAMCARPGCPNKFAPKNGQLYCSKECKRTDNATRANCAREECGAEFIRTKGGQRYCSPECSEGTSRDRYYARYGITEDDFDRMMEEQGGVCLICGNPSPPTRNGKTRRLAVDHDHETGAVRGLLCYDCNTALGMMQDDTARLGAAIKYLQRSQAEHS